MGANPESPPKNRPWRTCLDVEAQDAGHYLDYMNEALYRGIDGEPGRVLELGCSTGVFGKALKDRHPGTHVTGIEAGRAAAEIALTRIDRVIRARIEDVDFEAEGIAAGSLDLVVAGDVLEHLVNPWGILTRVRGLLAPGGRVVASIPNMRNFHIVSALLLEGRFQYVERGLLDVTHLRFFTFDEILVMLDDAGFTLESFLYTLSPALTDVYERGRAQEKSTLQYGRLTITDLTQRELMELCTEQYVVRARPRP
jgi:2-polyprenyl-3-methyl-5-hydroxy-6-metoxy-1,4-benzoquinol methylase